MPRVSVIIPTFDRGRVVAEAIESVLGQTFRDFDLTVVDDGSQDDTAAVLARFEGRIRVIRQPNQGVSVARNTGIQATSSEWVAFLDSDDQWKPRKLERQLAALEANPSLELCYTDEIWIRRGRRVNACKHHAKASGDLFERSLHLCLISPSSVLLRRRLLGEAGPLPFDPSLPACEDYDLWLRITCRHPVLFLPEPLIVKHGGHEDQLSGKFWGMDRFRVQSILRLLDAAVLTDDQRAAAIRVLNEKCSILASGARKRGRDADAQRWERSKRPLPDR